VALLPLTGTAKYPVRRTGRQLPATVRAVARDMVELSTISGEVRGEKGVGMGMAYFTDIRLTLSVVFLCIE